MHLHKEIIQQSKLAVNFIVTWQQLSLDFFLIHHKRTTKWVSPFMVTHVKLKCDNIKNQKQTHLELAKKNTVLNLTKHTTLAWKHSIQTVHQGNCQSWNSSRINLVKSIK